MSNGVDKRRKKTLDYNWEAISAISNIVLSILTLAALLITLYTVRLNNIPKGKLKFKSRKTNTLLKKYEIRFVNKRSAPITIIYVGFFIKTTDKRELVLKGKSLQKKLEWSDFIYYSTYDNDINEKIIDLGFKKGDVVKIYGFVVTTSNKVYKHKVLHKVQDGEDYEIKVELKDNN